MTDTTNNNTADERITMQIESKPKILPPTKPQQQTSCCSCSGTCSPCAGTSAINKVQSQGGPSAGRGA